LQGAVEVLHGLRLLTVFDLVDVFGRILIEVFGRVRACGFEFDDEVAEVR
jgi:hypothetical protein